MRTGQNRLTGTHQGLTPLQHTGSFFKTKAYQLLVPTLPTERAGNTMPSKDTASDRNGLGLQVWQRVEYRGKGPNLETFDGGGQRGLLWSFVRPADGAASLRSG